jgi:hypothetical protein
MLARGLGAAETAAAFAQAQEIATGIDDVPERFSALRGLWNGSFDRGEMAPMRELAAAMMREAESLPGLPELCTAHRLCAITCQVEGNFDGAREHLERAIAAYDGKHSPQRGACLSRFDVGLLQLPAEPFAEQLRPLAATS